MAAPRLRPLVGKGHPHATPAYVTVALITLLGIVVWPLMGHSLLPSFKERDFLMQQIHFPLDATLATPATPSNRALITSTSRVMKMGITSTYNRNSVDCV
jgi:hypothetical protein